MNAMLRAGILRSAGAGETHLTSLFCIRHRLLLFVPYPLDLAAGDLLATAVVKLGGAGIGMAGHVLGHLDRSAVLEEVGDAGRPPAVVTDRSRHPRLLGASLEHAPCVLLGHAVLGERGGLAAGRAEEGSALVLPDAGGIEVRIHVLLEHAVHGDLFALAAAGRRPRR